jgi:CDP-diacylglycerol---glycerol-3-phosphate 3-phosphatidyltransferase
MSDVLTAIRSGARARARVVAGALNRLSGGRITPAMVTIFGLLMHIPIAYLIAVESNYWAAGLLVVFGLFDILDGALASVQGTTSVRGMLLDASTDRMKEVLLFSGVAYVLASGDQPTAAVWAVAACGASLCVSYVKAKGEAAVASGQKAIPHTTLNRMFADGLLTFEIRMTLLIVGLVLNLLLPVVVIIACLASFTAIQRLIRISRQL